MAEFRVKQHIRHCIKVEKILVRKIIQEEEGGERERALVLALSSSI